MKHEKKFHRHAKTDKHATDCESLIHGGASIPGILADHFDGASGAAAVIASLPVVATIALVGGVGKAVFSTTAAGECLFDTVRKNSHVKAKIRTKEMVIGM